MIPALLLGLGGCGPGDGADTGALDPADTAAPEALAPLERAWSLDEVEAALLGAMARGIPQPFTVRAWFEDMLQVRRPAGAPDDGSGCPPVEAGSDTGGVVVSNWEGDCVSGGWELHGGWLWQETQSTDAEGDRLASDGVFSFTGTHDGGEVVAGGTLYIRQTVGADGGRSCALKLGGTYQDAVFMRWLGAGVSAGLELDGELSNGQLSATFEGSMSPDPEIAFYFDDFTLDGASCGAAPAGVIQMRDPSSGWFELDFGETCTACAAVSFGGEALGELCPGAALYDAAVAAFLAEDAP